MDATETQALAMEINVELLWKVGDYSLQVNREGHPRVTFPALARRKMEL